MSAAKKRPKRRAGTSSSPPGIAERGFGWGFGLAAAAATLYSVFFILRTSFTIAGVRYFSLFDDAMISMRYARHLAQGHGLVWNIGEAPVEGITNPLWTLVMTVIHLLPLEPQHTSLPIQLLGIVVLVVTLVFVRRLALLLTPSRGTALAAVVLVAFYYPLVNWTLQGMEVGLLAALTTAATWMVLSRQSPVKLYVVLAIGTLVRLDFAAVLVTLGAGAALLDRAQWRTHLALGLGTLVISLGAQTLARFLYFGDVLPNTYYLKLTGYPVLLRIARGAAVLWQFIIQAKGLPIVLPVLALVLADSERRRMMLLPCAVFGVMCAYSVWVGGDAWEAGSVANRFVAIAMPGLLVVGSALRWPRAPGFAALPKYLTPALAAVLVVAGSFALSPARQLLLLDPPLLVEANRNLTILGLAARNVTRPGAHVAAAAAGAIGYYSERNVVDLLGKSDRHIARLPMRQAITQNPLTYFYPGHLKWDYGYSIGQLQPDVISQLWEYRDEARPHLTGDYVGAGARVGDVTIGLSVRRNSQLVLWDRLLEPAQR